MRETLFRGKRVDNGKWVEGYYYSECGRHFIFENRQKDSILNKNIPYEVIPETVGQFTGLCDKNGKRIFEGDMCLHSTCAGTQTSKVEFYRYGFFAGDYPVSEDCEVIGNVYDNPELLNN